MSELQRPPAVPLSLSVRNTFAAVLALPDHDGICRTPHGYRFEVELTVHATPAETQPWTVDLLMLERLLNEHVCDPLEGADLREVLAYPSLEALVAWIVARLRRVLPGLCAVSVSAPPRYRVAWQAQN